MAPRDPIINDTSTPAGRPKDTSAGRIKPISGGGPNYSDKGQRPGSPPPNSPYSK